MNLRVVVGIFAILASCFSGGSFAGARVSTAPKSLIDLSNFSLTLPVNKDGKPSGTAETVSNDRLNGSPGYASQYFYSDDTGAVVFYAPSNGADGSPDSGADRARSELREIYKLSGPSEWTNSVGGTMTASCRVDKVAKKSGKATIGQIHGVGSMFMLLYYDMKKKTVEARFYDTPDNDSFVTYVLASKIDFGARIDYRIQWIGSTASVSVNRMTVNRTVSSSWNRKPVYFKAGAYSTANNRGNASDDGTRVGFYSLQLQH